MTKLSEKTSQGKRTLAQKLGLQAGMNAFLLNLPDEYFSWVELHEKSLRCERDQKWAFVHLFLTTTNDLEYWLNALRHRMESAGMIWVSWNKKSSRIPTELTEDIIRDTALTIGLVDIKVCSINQEWSALKLVIRKELR